MAATHFSKIGQVPLFSGLEGALPKSFSRAIPHVLSDQIPILLDTGEVSMCPSIFRFVNMWLSQDQFDNDVRQFWSSLIIITSDPSGRLVIKLRSLRSFLKSWSQQKNFSCDSK